MRERLFRGKRTDNSEWIEGDYAYSNTEDKYFIICSLEIQSCTYEKNALYTIDCYEVIPKTVGRYTGLTDKNDTKIFEGDNVKDGTSRVIYKVFYCVDSAMFIKEGVLRSSLGDTHHLEVIGNIHDNSELLRGRISNAD